jgi:hypothetical protein
MASVIDLGGLNLYSEDPGALAEWYAQSLGVHTTFNEEQKIHLGRLSSGAHFNILHIEPWMNAAATAMSIILKTDDLRALVKHLEGRGVKAELVEQPPHPRHADLTDPEGRRISIVE